MNPSFISFLPPSLFAHNQKLQKPETQHNNMSSLKRNASSLTSQIEEPSIQSSTSKKSKTHSNLHLPSSLSPETPISPATSVNSTATVVSDDHFSASSSNILQTIDAVENSTTTPFDNLQTSVLKKVGSSTPRDLELFSQDKWSLNEFCGDSEEMTKVAPKEEEIEEFFAMAEKYEQKRFAEKYNYDIVRDMPLEGKYEWVPLF